MLSNCFHNACFNLTGNWAGTMTVDGTTFQVTVTLAQNTSATLGVTSSSVDGNLRIVGVCLVPFTGGVLNLNTNTFTVGAGTDFSLISSVTNDSISGSINSIDPTPDDNEGCGSFQGPFSLTRAA